MSPAVITKCKTPTIEYLAPTPGPIFPSVITYGIYEVSQAWWASALKSCNLDKEAVRTEFVTKPIK